jgi:hypothetical protein
MIVTTENLLELAFSYDHDEEELRRSRHVSA